jgi:hypothetical protein
LYPVFYSNQKIVLLNDCNLRFISSLIRKFAQFLFFPSHFWSPLTKAIYLGSAAAAGSICVIREQLLPVSIYFSATRLSPLVLCSPCHSRHCPPLILFSAFNSGSVPESQGAAQFHPHPGQSLSFSLRFTPSAFPCSIQFVRCRLCLQCRVFHLWIPFSPPLATRLFFIPSTKGCWPARLVIMPRSILGIVLPASSLWPKR